MKTSNTFGFLEVFPRIFLPGKLQKLLFRTELKWKNKYYTKKFDKKIVRVQGLFQ